MRFDVSNDIACVFAKEKEEGKFEECDRDDCVELDRKAEGIDEKDDGDDRQYGIGK